MELSVQVDGQDLNLFLDLVNHEAGIAVVDWTLRLPAMLKPKLPHVPFAQTSSVAEYERNQVASWKVLLSPLSAQQQRELPTQFIEVKGAVTQDGGSYGASGSERVEALLAKAHRAKS